jgi:alpha-L-rhamnosidase
LLDPGFTKYSKQVEYEVYDITSQISPGNNVAGVMLGNGWWNPLPMKFFGRWSLADYQQTGRPCFKAEIHLTYKDGSQQIIPSDESWLAAPGPIVKNNVYLGEDYDARLEQKNWAAKGNDAAAWHNAVAGTGPSGMLTKQMQPAIKVTKVVKPVGIREITPGVFIVDMGQNFAGVARIKVQGPAGTKIAIRYGEDIFKDGTLNFYTSVFTQVKKGGINAGPGAPETAWQQDNYTLKGKGVEEWSPRFTFHAFRYLEVAGWPGKPTLDDFAGLRMNSDLQQDGDFSCSNPMLNQLHTVVQWTYLSNVFSVESDCPGREKFGYGADMVTASDVYFYNYNMANFYTKSVTDFANDQRPEGGITETAPFVGIADRGYGDDSGPMGWQLAFAWLQKRLYDYYGDKRVIEQNYPALLKQIDFLQSKTIEGLLYWDIGDHEALDPKAEAFSASAFYYHNLTIAADLAGILGKTDDSLRFSKIATRTKALIVNKYWVPGAGRFDNSTQGAQLFALWYKLSPEDSLSFERYTDEVKRHNGHLATGIFSTKMMFDVLRQHNRNDMAYSIATQKDYPGWGYMLANGATTLWETWRDPGTGVSENHPMFGSVDEWFYRSLLGINPDGPGFSKIIIKPQPAGHLTWAKGSYNSIKGLITSDWKIEGGKFILNVTVPANTSATVFIPSKNGGKIREGNEVLKDVVYQDGYAVVKVGSGMYSFVAER